MNAVETAFAAVILKPDCFREFELDVRTCPVPVFPYILYTFREHDIMILAVKHDRRDPDYWRYRVDHRSTCNEGVSSTGPCLDVVLAEQGGEGKSGGPATQSLGSDRYFGLETVG